MLSSCTKWCIPPAKWLQRLYANFFCLPLNSQQNCADCLEEEIRMEKTLGSSFLSSHFTGWEMEGPWRWSHIVVQSWDENPSQNRAGAFITASWNAMSLSGNIWHRSGNGQDKWICWKKKEGKLSIKVCVFVCGGGGGRKGEGEGKNMNQLEEIISPCPPPPNTNWISRLRMYYSCLPFMSVPGSTCSSLFTTVRKSLPSNGLPSVEFSFLLRDFQSTPQQPSFS